MIALYLLRRYEPHRLVARHISPVQRSFVGGLWLTARIGGVAIVAAHVLIFYNGWEYNGDWLAYYRAARIGELTYPQSLNTYGAYLYSPAFAQAFKPLAIFTDSHQFFAVFAALDLAALLYLAGPIGAPLALAFEIVRGEIRHGNIHLLVAAAIALGLRYPGFWAFVLLTKVTPGIGLLWFALHREWRRLAVALGVTFLVVLISLPFDLGAWPAWISSLAGNTSIDQRNPILLVDREVRWAAAVVLIVGGTLRNWRWTVPAAAMLAVPIFWTAAITMLLGVLPLAARARTGLLGPEGSNLVPHRVGDDGIAADDDNLRRVEA